ncbi:hypothetical protein EDF63_3394 [Curtobacterium sp. JUb34]|uniref:hypothetical protein n=1 Tax=Curtobacterium sp. JUb34 TaxID=2485109 RepID=UPI000F48FBE5|nr:hypothetical protein [Curtobacterium sp. JUb34]ROR28806.1 hypothetical protein EDF63_3394 [Curtobacterium sp. JUb34]
MTEPGFISEADAATWLGMSKRQLADLRRKGHGPAWMPSGRFARYTVASVAAYALSLAGRTRDKLPVPWTASAVTDDCAAFCSHVLWGGKPGPIIWVDGFKSAGDGTYAAGSGDLQPWDVLLFDWDANGVGNHVEFMVADLCNGYVRTFGANGSDTRPAAYRVRPKCYILGRFRRRWRLAPAPPDQTATPPATALRRHRMYTFVPLVQKSSDKPKAIYVCRTITGKTAPIQSLDHKELLERWRDNEGGDKMLAAEAAIVRTYLNRNK